MPITCNTNGRKIREYLDEKFARRMEVWANILDRAGEEAVRVARLNHKYLNQTGNLASSVGYAIVHNGQVIKKSTFEVIKDGADGSKLGRDYLEQVIAENAQGLVLIIVAGMPYAGYVEAMGLDVLDSAKLEAGRVIELFTKALKLSK
ncbi:MAG: hypothetical protein MJZ26_09110 [Fibrobacter sp.]|nr:hypothetical protein [Fibrobacter sp.]